MVYPTFLVEKSTKNYLNHLFSFMAQKILARYWKFWTYSEISNNLDGIFWKDFLYGIIHNCTLIKKRK